LRLEIGPYIGESLDRVIGLLTQEATGEAGAYDDVVRAAVVLTHAYLEDFLRTMARTLLPVASEGVLDDIPLAGSGSSRPAKFSLGALARHRGRTVEDVINDSVSEYLERSNSNNTTEIVSFLKDLDITLPAEASEKLPELDRMI
jgi:hypothetical protein